MNKKTLLLVAALTLGGAATVQAATPAATSAKTATAPAKKAPVHRHVATAKPKAAKKS